MFFFIIFHLIFQWPPIAISKHFNVGHIVTHCLDKEKLLVEDLKTLEQSTSLNNLPDSRELKCYLNCVFASFGLLNVKTGKIESTKAAQAIKLFTPEDQLKFFKLIKRCHSEAKEARDFAYEFHLCARLTRRFLYIL